MICIGRVMEGAEKKMTTTIAFSVEGLGLSRAQEQ